MVCRLASGPGGTWSRSRSRHTRRCARLGTDAEPGQSGFTLAACHARGRGATMSDESMAMMTMEGREHNAARMGILMRGDR